MPQHVQQTVQFEAERSRLNEWLVILLFGAILLTPFVTQVIGYTTDSTTENRVLAPFPKISSLREIKLLPKMSENYVNDRFGLRRQLVHFNSLARYRLGLSSSKDVVVGKDGWLFYTADKLMEQHTGADLFTPAELENWVKQMETDRDWLAKRGIPFYIVIAPDKNTIYPEKLPAYPRGAVTRIDQLAARLRSSDLEFIDPRQELFRVKAAGEMVYTPGDTHWNERGAFVAYQMLMERMQKKYPSIVPLRLDDFNIRYDVPAGTDLTLILTLEQDIRYSVERMTPKWKSHQTAPQTTTYRPGWGWRVTANTNDLKDRPRLLVFGDSFTDYVLGPYMLYETFRDPVWTGHNGATFNFNLVKEVNPDVVVVQIAERYLHIAPVKPVGFDEPAAGAGGN
jgi:alginate O-acetyltransferase complex protein AlgJ